MYYNNRMIELSIPGQESYQFNHLVCDVNGTLALDGKLIDGVARSLNTLRDRLTIHLVTAETHNRQDEIDRILGMRAIRIQPGEEAEQKAEYIRKLGADQVVSIGQGANDELMLKESRLGICVLSREGATTTTLLSADLIVPDILSALELIEKPLRLIATLRK